jgi:hypothetical protein
MIENGLAVSKRVYVTLPDSVYEDLERWADDQGRPVANLTAYIVEKSVEQAKEEGKIPLPKPKTSSSQKKKDE